MTDSDDTPEFQTALDLLREESADDQEESDADQSAVHCYAGP